MEELLPPAAAAVETLRRDLLDVFDAWGYDLVTPPLVEHLDALSVGAGADLEREVFPLTDQLTGRLLGVRTDMTTQVARIDARMAARRASGGALRLAYVGSVLRARAADAASSRNPVQVGAELYGHNGLESDFESIALMLETLRRAGVAPLHLDLGHVGIFRTLADAAGLDDGTRERLHLALQRKAAADIEAALAAFTDRAAAAAPVMALGQLARLNGAVDVLDAAREQFAGAPTSTHAILDHLATLASMIVAAYPDIDVHIDLAELRGFRYHTGLVFAAFTPGFGREIARGGRYDGVGAAFGESRAATGFSADLRVLSSLRGGDDQRTEKPPRGVLAPPVSTGEPDPGLERKVSELRAAGVRVLRELPGSAPAPSSSGQLRDRLVREADDWVVRALPVDC